MTTFHKIRALTSVSLLSIAVAGCATLQPTETTDDLTIVQQGAGPALVEPTPMIDPASVSSEGMWRPDQLPGLEPELKALGLELSASDLSNLTTHPMNAVISLGNCTASFVSPQGLAVTNHHCAYGSIQFNSTEDNNLLAYGFLAETLADELPAAPGSRIYVTTSIENVTDRVTADIDDSLSGRERFQIIDQRRKDITAECEETPGNRCVVSAFHGGLEYRLTRRLEIKDVRLTYAPASSIGKFGGDIDNWMWPRHTGDFAFYRAYVGPDGQPAEYSEDNVPFTPPSHLKLYSEPLADGDFVMVAGYPGRTNRYRRLSEVENAFYWSYPERIKLYSAWIEAIEAAAPKGSDAHIKYASLLAGLNNATKNYGGQLEGAERVGLVDRRKAREAALNDWINADPARAEKYGDAVKALDELVEADQATRERDLYYALATRTAPLRQARRLVRLANERQKPDAERESGYQERDMAFFKQGLEAMDRRYDADVDKAVWAMFIKQYLALPDDQQVGEFNTALGLSRDMSDKKLNKVLSRYFAKTKMGDKETRLGLMEASLDDLKTSKDPFINLAMQLYASDMTEEEREKDIAGQFQLLRPKYMDAIIAWQEDQGQPVYPDANSTLRVTFGTVKGDVSPKDGLVYTPFTTLDGITQKYTGEDPFDSPDKQMLAIEEKTFGGYVEESLGSVPVNFLTTLDVTGGNSGSPTFNAKGELVGLLFDGTYESVNSDWDFDTESTRSIHVDARYMLWVMDVIDGAHNLLDEMGVAPSIEDAE